MDGSGLLRAIRVPHTLGGALYLGTASLTRHYFGREEACG
jgi:hypothetical protein